MPAFKTVTNPKTGKMETVEVPSDEAIQRKLAQEHKELRDMLDGNTQFHDDPYKKVEEIPKPDVADMFSDIPLFLYDCKACGFSFNGFYCPNCGYDQGN